MDRPPPWQLSAYQAGDINQSARAAAAAVAGGHSYSYTKSPQEQHEQQLERQRAARVMYRQARTAQHRAGGQGTTSLPHVRHLGCLVLLHACHYSSSIWNGACHVTCWSGVCVSRRWRWVPLSAWHSPPPPTNPPPCAFQLWSFSSQVSSLLFCHHLPGPRPYACLPQARSWQLCPGCCRPVSPPPTAAAVCATIVLSAQHGTAQHSAAGD
jgi:hypothetical protein